MHPLILRSRALFYRTDCTRRFKFLTHALLPKFTKYIVWPWGSQGEDGVNQIVSMGVDQEISDFLIGDLEIWPALDLIDMSIVVRIDVGSRLFMLL